MTLAVGSIVAIIFPINHMGTSIASIIVLLAPEVDSLVKLEVDSILALEVDCTVTLEVDSIVAPEVDSIGELEVERLVELEVIIEVLYYLKYYITRGR